MQVDIKREFNVSAEEIKALSVDAGTKFVEKWRGPACDNFKKQAEHESLIPESIERFMRCTVKGIESGAGQFHWTLDSHVNSDARRNHVAHVQVAKSILDPDTGALDEKCIWLVDCRSAAVDGGVVSALEVPRVLEQILKWMSGVTRWNAVIMLSPAENATEVRNALDNTDGYEDIVMQDGMYTFSR